MFAPVYKKTMTTLSFRDEKLETKLKKIQQQKLPWPRIILSKSQLSKLDSVEVGVLLTDFAQWLRRNNKKDLTFQFRVIDFAGIPTNLVLN